MVDLLRLSQIHKGIVHAPAKVGEAVLAYGMSQYKLASTLQISVEEAERIISNYFRKVPKVKSFLTGLGELAKTNGYIRTGDLYRRIRWFEGYNNKDDFKRQGQIEREGKNLPIQGANANILKKSLVDIYKKIINNNYPVKMLLTVHDENITETPKEFSRDWKPILADTMISAGNEIITSVPMKVDVKIGKTWHEIH